MKTWSKVDKVRPAEGPTLTTARMTREEATVLAGALLEAVTSLEGRFVTVSIVRGVHPRILTKVV